MSNVIVSIDDKGVALLELNRHKVLNALSIELMCDFRDALAELAQSEEVRALIVTGRGSGFCAGADLRIFDDASRQRKSQHLNELVAENMEKHFNPMMNDLYDFPKPVISAVNGVAAGGGAALALCADIVLVSSTASMKIVQVPTLGIVADLGANWLIPRIIGRGRTLGMILLGEAIDASTLCRWGLAWDSFSPDVLIDESRKLANKLVGLPANTIIATRRLVDSAFGCSFSEVLAQERKVQRELVSGNLILEERIHSFRRDT